MQWPALLSTFYHTDMFKFVGGLQQILDPLWQVFKNFTRVVGSKKIDRIFPISTHPLPSIVNGAY